MRLGQSRRSAEGKPQEDAVGLGTVGRLHWSNGLITRTAQRYARDLHALATLRLPPLCEDVRAWRAAAFQVAPPAAASLVRRVEAIEPKPVPPRLLAPFERGGDASLVSRTASLERRLVENEFLVGQLDWNQVLETLALNQ